jgi:hypothetical protein
MFAAGAAGDNRRMRFRATLELHGKTATGFQVPPEIVTALGSSKRPAVRVSIGPHTYRSTVAAMNGVYLLPLSAENRTAAGISAGDEVDVKVELDDQPRTVTVPADLAAALAAEPDAQRAFDALAFTHKKEHCRAIEDAKKPETRQRRLEKTMSMLRG